MTSVQSHLYILVTIVLTVYGQLIVKWRMLDAGSIPAELSGKLAFYSSFLMQPWILTVYLATLVAGISWMTALSRLELNYAYPFMSITFVLVMIMSSVFFRESITVVKVAGMGLIVVGLLLGSRG